MGAYDKAKEEETIIAAYATGARFMIVSDNGMTKRTEFATTRGLTEKICKTRRISGGRVETFYVLPEGKLRPCARGKRT